MTPLLQLQFYTYAIDLSTVQRQATFVMFNKNRQSHCAESLTNVTTMDGQESYLILKRHIGENDQNGKYLLLLDPRYSIWGVQIW